MGTIDAGSWAVYQYSFGEGMRASILVQLEAAREPEHRGHDACRRVIFFSPHEHVRPDGLPQAGELARLAQEEDALVHALEAASVDCRKVGRMLYGAMSDVVFQVADVAGFARVVERFRAERRGQRIEVRESAGWTFFDEKLRPSPAHWQWIDNSRVVAALMQHGTRLDAPHVLDHTFVGEPRAIDEIAAMLDARGLPGSKRAAADRLELPQRVERLDIDEITTWTIRFHGLAGSLGARYDGWGAAIQR